MPLVRMGGSDKVMSGRFEKIYVGGQIVRSLNAKCRSLDSIAMNDGVMGISKQRFPLHLKCYAVQRLTSGNKYQERSNKLI